MICECCGSKYLVNDAIEEFDTFFDGLSYELEFWGDHYCADCAIDKMKVIIRSQEGFDN